MRSPARPSGNADHYPHDLETARRLLEEAGYTDRDGDGIREAYGIAGVDDGTPLRVRWTILDREEMGEAIQVQWHAIGIDVAIEIVPGPVQLEMVNNRDFDRAGRGRVRWQAPCRTCTTGTSSSSWPSGAGNIHPS